MDIQAHITSFPIYNSIASMMRYLAVFALSLFTFAVYATGTCRTIYVGDSGELVTAAAILGIPHPSGYPLYVLLGKLWTLLVPIGSIAFRMSLFSAFWAAATCGALYLFGARLRWAASTRVFVSLLVAFGPSFWSQANIQRVYSLNAFFVVVVVWATVVWHQERKSRYLVLAAFLAGLGASNHTFLGVMTVAVGLFAVASQPRVLLDAKTILACAVAALAGLLPYAYLPIRSRMDPRLDWGNPESLEGFLDVILRRDFWTRSWLESPTDFLAIGADYAASLGSELLWMGTALAALGLAVGWKRWPVLLPALVMAVNFAAMALHGSRSDLFIWHRYYIPSYLMAAVLAGCGWQWIVEQWIVEKWTVEKRVPEKLRQRLAWAVLVIPLALLALGWRDFDRSRFRIAEDFSRTLLSTLPPGAHLSASDDNVLFVLIYLTMVEGLRPDVNLILQGVGDANLPALRFDPETEPLFFTHHPNWNFPGLGVVPTGLVFRTVKDSQTPQVPSVPKWKLDGEDDPRVPKDYLTQNLIGHFHYMLGTTFEHGDWPRAQEEFEKAMTAASVNDVLFYNMGLIYRRNGLFDRSVRSFERSREINPRHIASNRPVRATDRLAETKTELARIEALERELAEPGMEQLGPGTTEYHLRLADALAARGEPLAGRGHQLRAQELRHAERARGSGR